MVDIQDLFDDAKCFDTIREMRRPDGVTCPDARRPRSSGMVGMIPKPIANDTSAGAASDDSTT